jgi:hypothetical protein
VVNLCSFNVIFDRVTGVKLGSDTLLKLRILLYVNRGCEHLSHIYGEFMHELKRRKTNESLIPTVSGLIAAL